MRAPRTPPVLGELWLASPLLVLTLLAPPAIDPSFAFPFQCICTLGRLLCLPRVLHLVRRLFALGPCSPGPVGRLHCILRDHPCFRPLVEGALQDPSVVGPAWRYQLRDAWRCSHWQSLRRDWPDFAGIENGINRDTSLHRLRAWMFDADSLQSAIDAGKASNPPEPKLDVRVRLGVLRRLLRDSRLRKQGSSQCSCGLDVESVLHILWDCPVLSSARGDLAVHCSQLPSPLPACFRYVGVPVGFEAPAALAAKIHCRLVDVWQEYIGRRHAQSLAPLPRSRILGKRPPRACSSCVVRCPSSSC